MSSPASSTSCSLALFVAAYLSALEKLRALGVRTANGRLLAYRKHLERALEAELRDPDATFPHQEEAAFLNALLETSDIASIAQLEPSLLVAHHVVTKFRQLGRGSEFMNPDVDDPARNYAFEFSTAATAARHGRLIGFQSGD